MRRIFWFAFFISFFLMKIPFNAFSQMSIANKLWVGQNHEYVFADSATIRFETFTEKYGNTRLSRYYSIEEDTLKIVEPNRTESGLTSNFKLHFDKKGRLIFVPLNSDALLLTNLITLDGVRQNLIYTDISNFPFDSLKFEKITFITTECYGKCPVMAMEINDQKQIKFIGISNTVATGNFVSTLSNEQFEKLMNILRFSQLDEIECGRDRNIDLSTYSIEIHYNNRSRKFKTCMLPFVLNDLKEFLIALPYDLKFNEAEEKFGIKDDSQ